jgi:hypothetical protein
MTNRNSVAKTLMLTATIIMCLGVFTQVHAQRDPFRKASWATPKTQKPAPASSGVNSKGPKAPVNYGPPAIEARIEHYKRLREAAVASGQPIPKVTSVLTLNEMALTGIFKTPRGYAAMVEATPIKLSYTIYPGEKFFDGQLVAVEDNRLVFRKVTKTGEGKFVSSVEYMPLKQYSVRSQVEGTAPAGTTTASRSTAGTTEEGRSKPDSNPFLSPLEEMNQKANDSDGKAGKATKKTVRVAKRP